MKVLVAEDSSTDRRALESMLEAEGITVVCATNGQEAVTVFDHERPDVVFLDIMLPVMDGCAATRVIKQHSSGQFVPVILLTSSADDPPLARCLETGGDDFLTRPYSPALVKAKLEAMTRLKGRLEALKARDDLLERYQERILGERELARNILNRILQWSCLDSLQVKYRLHPTAVLNGDLVYAARTPSGELHVMLGDFAGRGLSAVIGALPAAEVFYRMTTAGHGIKAIITELNTKFRNVLPSYLFCSACFVRIDPGESSLLVWNGGLPDVLVYRSGRGIERRFPSRHAPLGVIAPGKFDPTPEAVALTHEDRVYLYTDGLVKAIDRTGKPFGQDRLEACFDHVDDPERAFEDIQACLSAHCSDTVQDDDYAWVELTRDAVPDPEVRPSADETWSAPADFKWTISLEMGSDYLRNVDPLPELMRMISGRPILGQHKETLFVILRELFTNSLDHGLLSLDSSLKGSPEGFAQYYALRDERLARLKEGRITIHLVHVPLGERGKVTVHMQDSGCGFDHRARLWELSENTDYFGRGIPLLRSVCHTLNYFGSGNTVEAVYAW